jgi:MFS family permease
MTAEERKVILASSAGTIFEWYDFYLYGSLAAIIGAQFFTPFPEATRNVFALLAFAAGFIVRPFGALVFGSLGDLIGRKYTFLMTILIMGVSTFLVGLLPNYYSWGVAAPIILIALRMLQGLALGGEYGGAAVYVAEHAPANQRGYFTAFIQTTATLGLLLSLIVILSVTGYVNGRFPDQPILDAAGVATMNADGTPAMMKARTGRIVNVGSVVGMSGSAGQINYAAAKAGLLGMSRAVARELASRNVTCNVVAPGPIETAMTETLPQEWRTRTQETVPLGRFGTPEEVAAVVAFLCSPAAS